jgi:hypothetical protein
VCNISDLVLRGPFNAWYTEDGDALCAQLGQRSFSESHTHDLDAVVLLGSRGEPYESYVIVPYMALGYTICKSSLLNHGNSSWFL